jgi:hypothetical protein
VTLLGVQSAYDRQDITAMLWFTLGTIGGIAIAGTTAIYIKQAIIDRANCDTDGYF